MYCVFITAFKCRHEENFFGDAQFLAHHGGFIIHFPASLKEKTSYNGFARLPTFCVYGPTMRLFALKRIAEIDEGPQRGVELQLPC